ncbi:MAG TPA: tRNA (N(6)-L-threonylcarbamoyladenosine(37)-C(2))-methylthiotransferase MtaB [Caulobacteraceae bacterium]|nr:tRNA (N(6)-L-threonylcarbamoyladenosine(37)-C(2))-methylthiotransferase MtaB [Caulobacteraceae bacterium]
MNTPFQGSEPLEVVTFGCRLNACESEALRRQAEAQNFADTVVFNTCAVTLEAARQARQAIRKTRRERPNARLVATGCAVQTDPAAFAAMAELDLVLGNAEKLAPGAFGPGPKIRVGDIMRPQRTDGRWGAARRSARAYVEIQNGCDHRCTFCIIPLGRGNSRSAPAEKVIGHVRAAIAAGCAEVALTGVDLTSWGADLGGAPRLGELVRRILREAPELPRLRLSSIDAAEADEALIEAFGCEARLMPHLHLSLQSGDDLILKRMKRRHSRGQALTLIERLRRARPGIAIGADLIAGFPTETDSAFENTLRLVEEAGLAFAHVFPFSPRPGTPAARMPQVPRDVVRRRAGRLRAATEAARARHLERRVGTGARALVEGAGRARDEDYTEVAFSGEAHIGAIIAGAIVGSDRGQARLGAWQAA